MWGGCPGGGPMCGGGMPGGGMAPGGSCIIPGGGIIPISYISHARCHGNRWRVVSPGGGGGIPMGPGGTMPGGSMPGIGSINPGRGGKPPAGVKGHNTVIITTK